MYSIFWLVFSLVLLALVSLGCGPSPAQQPVERDNPEYKSGDLGQAIVEYTKAIELDPKDAHAYYNRGLAYSDKGNLDQAIANFNKAIELDPKDDVAYNNRGIAYRQQGLKSEAIADFQMYLTLAPTASDRAQVEQWIRELKGQ